GMPSEKALEHKLNAIKGYRDQFQEVFGTDVTAENVAKALAAFQRTILSGNAPYDRYKAGHEEALSEEAVRGMKLFFGKANCFACHSGRSFTDNNVHNLGIGYDPLTDSFDDVGHEKVTGAPEDRGTFKTPTLREIRRTSPYITHNGQFEFKSLKHAVEFYDQGGIPNDDLDEEIFPLNLTAEEKADLVRFLEEGLSSAAGPDIQALKSPSSTTNQATALWWILGIVAVLLAVVYGFVRRARGVATILLATICASVGCDSGEKVAEEKVTAPSLAEGLDNPCGVAVQPETGHVFVSTKERIIRVVPGNPPTVSDEITDFPTARYRPVPFQFGPLGLAFLGKDILVVGDGSLPDGEDLVRFYKVGSKARPRGKALTVADMMYSSGPIPRGEDSNSGEGNFYGIAVTRSTIFVTCNGDDTKGWISKIELGGGKPGPLTPFIKSKVETERDAPTGAVITPDGELLVTQLGELTRSRNSLLTFYDPSTGTLKRKLETGLRDLIAVAYSPKTGKLYGLDFSYRLLDDGKLCRLVIDGDEVRTEKILSLYGPTAMAFAPDGTLYVAIIDEAKEGDEKKPGKLLGIKGL
ncbi:MAG: hypothetical protein O7J95_18545, partial [Planctomycetota bacterium]|nr:hypothetical protein [Planctomycetota bacterium]